MRIVAVLGILALAGCLGTAPQASPDAPAPPTGELIIGAVGMSFMRGDNAIHDWSREHSWATGIEVESIAVRLNATGVNMAQGGAYADQFVAQVDALGNVDLVFAGFLTLQGTGCHELEALLMASNEGPEGDYETNLRHGIEAIHAAGAQAFLITIPDFRKIAAAHPEPPTAPHEDPVAAGLQVAFWSSVQQCAASPDYGGAWQSWNDVIVRVAEETGARHDGGAIAEMDWTPAMVSEVDGFHPSIEGLNAMADIVWNRL